MKTRVLQIIDHLGLGGAQLVAKGIFEAFQKDAMFLYALRRSPYQMMIDHDNVHIADTTHRYDIKSSLDAAKLAKTTKAKILHCHLEKATALGILLKMFVLRNTKLIVHEHGQIFQRYARYTRMVRLFRNVIDLFIAVSHATKQKLVENTGVNPCKIEVLHNFVDITRFQYDKEKQPIERAARQDFCIGFAGRLAKQKGWEQLLHAASILKDKDPEVRFLIAGDGPDKNKMINLMKQLNLENRVEYLGLVPDMPKFYNLLDCLVIPSRWEPLGIVAIEAQASGIPVIGSNIDGLAEIITDRENGLLFEVKNVQDLVHKIRLIKEDSDLREAIVETGKQTVKKYSVTKYIDSIRKVYEELGQPSAGKRS